MSPRIRGGMRSPVSAIMIRTTVASQAIAGLRIPVVMVSMMVTTSAVSFQKGSTSSINLGISTGVDRCDVFTDYSGLVLLLEMGNTRTFSGNQEILGSFVGSQGGPARPSLHCSGSRRLYSHISPSVPSFLSRSILLQGCVC